MHFTVSPFPALRPRVSSSIVALLLCAGIGGTAFAQTPLAGREPGLWELRLVDGSSLASIALGMEQAMKNLPEAQRRQMERLLGGGSLKLPTVIRECLTPELAHKDLKTELTARNIDCSELDWQEAADGGRFSFVCTNADGDWTGQGRIWDATARNFKTEATVQGKYRGQPVSLDMKHEAQWLGPDCQSGKPVR